MPNDEPHFIDKWEADQHAKEARARALSRASRPRSEANEEVRRKYARQGLERETELLSHTTEGRRNDQLNISAMKLYQLCAAGYLDELEVESELERACHANGYIKSDGRRAFKATMKSAKSKGMSEPRDLDEVGVHGISEYTPEMARIRLKSDQLADVEGDFWMSRESLSHIWTEAMAGLLSPWALLGCCVAKALTLCPPSVTLPALVGTTGGSLNWFCILAGESGFGKSVTMASADKLIKSTVQQRNIGSGEGMIEVYRRPKSDEEPGNYEAIMFVADEIETLTAHKSRTGSTTLAMMRSAFSGVTLGASTKASSNFHLPAHTYRMTLIVGAQPGRVGVLADDADAGTPQRFMWFPATDDRVEEHWQESAAELDVPTALTSEVMKYGAELQVPEVIRSAVVRNRVAVMKGRGRAEDSHKLFVREKFAYGLALIDGRDYMTEDDWRLSGVAMKVSDYTRQWVMDAREEVEEQEAQKLGRTTGMVAAAAEQQKQASTDHAINRVVERLAAHINSSGPDGITQAELSRKMNSRDRGLFVSALSRLETNDMAMKLDRRWYIFDARRRDDYNNADF